MAVARMSRVTVFGHASVLDRTVGLLQQAGALDVTATIPEDTEAPEGLEPIRLSREDERLRALEEYVADAQFVRDFLGRYHKPDVPFGAFISEKVHLGLDEFLALEPDDGFLALYDECVRAADEMASGGRERERLVRLIADLEPWREFRMQIDEWRGTEHVVLFTGTVPASRGPVIRQMLRDAVDEVTVDELGAAGPRQAWVVMAHESCLEQVRATLALTDFAEVSFPGLHDAPAEEIAIARDQISAIDRRAADLAERAEELAIEHYHTSVALVEALQSRLEALMVRERFGATERTFVATGWARESTRSGLTDALAPLDGSVDVEFAEATAADAPPILLDNPRWLKPFEVLTDLYGRPCYDELDPTPLLAPFFFLFFGICIGDVGYGAMLIVGAYLIKTKLDVAPGVKKFMDLLIAGGIAAILVGVAFGSYFALDLAALPQVAGGFVAAARFLQVLDPLAELTTFLVITVILGLTQVLFGVIVAAWDAWRKGDPSEALFGQLSTIFLFAMIGVSVAVPGAARWALPFGLVATMAMQGRALQAAIGDGERPVADRAAGALWVLAVAASVVLMALGSVPAGLALVAGASVLGAIVSPSARAGVLGLLGGAYSVYGMSSFIGDVLSYTRLAALGLSGALVGLVFNLLAGMVMGGATGLFKAGGASILFGLVVVVLAAAVFVVGHVFNVVINLLGAFVHPARLQFVEFFSKFYEGGGRPYEPFRYRTKALVLHDAGPEGGR